MPRRTPPIAWTLYLAAMLLCGPAHGAEPVDAAVARIAFGSCADQEAPQPIWDAVVAADPDVFVFLGDNVYGDTEDMEELRAKYALLAEKPGFQRLRADTPLLAVWDDHDYGLNDSGAEFPQKRASKDVFLEFFAEPADSPRRTRDGLYTATTLGPPGRRVQVILLDLRWFRTPLAARRRTPLMKARGIGPYLPDDSEDASLLGAAQWAWLEAQLREPADARIIGTSIQLLAEGSGWETWSNFPRERQRFFDLVAETDARGVVLISGDMHWAELSRVASGPPYPLLELTSSGLTEVWHTAAPNTHRASDVFLGANFGVISLDWDARTVTLEVRDQEGAARIRTSVALDELR